MAIEQNKTALTHRVTAGVIEYLKRRRFRPIIEEMSLSGWGIADVAAMCHPTMTAAVNLGLVKACPKAPHWKNRNEEEWREWNAQVQAIDASYQALPNCITCIVEVKTSMSDFRRDRKWQRPAASHMRILAAPDKLLQSILPDPRLDTWWIVSFHDSGRCKKVLQRVDLATIEHETTAGFACAMVDRLWMREETQGLRDLQQKQRAQQSDMRSARNFRQALSVVCDVLEGGKSFDDAMSFYTTTRQRLGDLVGRVERLRERIGQ